MAPDDFRRAGEPIALKDWSRQLPVARGTQKLWKVKVVGATSWSRNPDPRACRSGRSVSCPTRFQDGPKISTDSAKAKQGQRSAQRGEEAPCNNPAGFPVCAGECQPPHQEKHQSGEDSREGADIPLLERPIGPVSDPNDRQTGNPQYQAGGPPTQAC